MVETMKAGMGPKPHIIYCFNRFILINLFLTIHPINIVLGDLLVIIIPLR
jgi:hypothetical protein